MMAERKKGTFRLLPGKRGDRNHCKEYGQKHSLCHTAQYHSPFPSFAIKVV